MPFYLKNLVEIYVKHIINMTSLIPDPMFICMPSSFFPYFIFFILIVYFIVCSHSHLSTLFPLPPPPHSHHTVVHVHESFIIFTQSLHPLTFTLKELSACSLYQSVSILLVSPVCSLDSTYE